MINKIKNRAAVSIALTAAQVFGKVSTVIIRKLSGLDECGFCVFGFFNEIEKFCIGNYVIDVSDVAELKQIGLADLRAVAEVDLGFSAREEGGKDVMLGLDGVKKSAVGRNSRGREKALVDMQSRKVVDRKLTRQRH